MLDLWVGHHFSRRLHLIDSVLLQHSFSAPKKYGLRLRTAERREPGFMCRICPLTCFLFID